MLATDEWTRTRNKGYCWFNLTSFVLEKHFNGSCGEIQLKFFVVKSFFVSLVLFFCEVRQISRETISRTDAFDSIGSTLCHHIGELHNFLSNAFCSSDNWWHQRISVRHFSMNGGKFAVETIHSAFIQLRHILWSTKTASHSSLRGVKYLSRRPSIWSIPTWPNPPLLADKLFWALDGFYMAKVVGKYPEDTMRGTESDGCGQLPPYPAPVGAIILDWGRGVVFLDAAAVFSSSFPSLLLIFDSGQDVVVTERPGDFGIGYPTSNLTSSSSSAVFI